MFNEGTVLVARNGQDEIPGYMTAHRPGGFMLRMINAEHQLARVWVPDSFVFEEVPGPKNLPGLLLYHSRLNRDKSRKGVRKVVADLTKKPTSELGDVVKVVPLADIVPESALAGSMMNEELETLVEIMVRLQPRTADERKATTTKLEYYDVVHQIAENLPAGKRADIIERILIESKQRFLLGYYAKWINDQDRFLRIARGPLATDDKGEGELNGMFEGSGLFDGEGVGHDVSNDFAGRIVLDPTCGKPWRETALYWISDDAAGVETLAKLRDQLDDKDLRAVAEELRVLGSRLMSEANTTTA